MDKSPRRPSMPLPATFSPLKLPSSPSPQGNLTGTKRVVKDLVADVFNSIQKWNDLHLKGCELVKTISNLKQDEPSLQSSDLEDVCNQLSDVVAAMEHPKNNLVKYGAQMKALSRLSSSTFEPVFISLDVKSISSLVDCIVGAYDEEYGNKQFILEHIPFTKSVKEVGFLAVLWTYQSFVNAGVSLKLETLLVEVGHRKIC